MRIISNFKDYYDGVQAMGHDETLAYRRIQQKFSADQRNREADPAKVTLVRDLYAQAPRFRLAHWQPTIVGVCGKLYLAACHQVEHLGKTQFTYYYSTESLQRAFPEAGYATDWRGRKIEDTYDPDRYPELGLYDQDDELFLRLGVPVFAVENLRLHYGHNGHFTHDQRTLLLNPSLKQFEFYRLLSDYEVFQELEMYLGNVLVGAAMEPAPITDLDKVRSHGFDDKMGFRKRKKQ